MAPLATSMRQRLEKAVVAARKEAEAAARAVLEHLAVERNEPYPSMSPEERHLRNALRARRRVLGQERPEQGTAALVEEIAYQGWHRMLFARFLAENELLMHPSGAVLTLDLCDELAREEQRRTGVAVDAWDVAARYAAEMLPGIFQADDPAARAALRFAPEGRQALERILLELPAEVFTADDALGWIYQFWQREAKEAVNDSGRKIGGADLAPVTQLFTEPYMVQFLLQNSLGAWWAARHPDSPLLQEFRYLRFRDDGTPAAGCFPHWPERAAEVTVMDPCCGSGHFLVEAFRMLRAMRMEEEGLSGAAAGEAVLRENLFGLELDPRCVQIAAFALALAAWQADGYRPLPVPNLACSGIPVQGQLETWRRLAGRDGWLAQELERLYHLFRQAPTLGSLINPNDIAIQQQIFVSDFAEIEPLLVQAVERERAKEDPVAAVFGEAARGVVRAAKLLASTYTLVATNVPFLGRGDQDDTLREYCDRHHPDAKADLATAFVERCRAFAKDEGRGSYALVTPQNWLFLTSYRTLREKLLREQAWNHVCWVDEGAFASKAAAGAFPALLIITNSWPSSDHRITGLSVSGTRVSAEKAALLRGAPIHQVAQGQQLRHPDARIALKPLKGGTLLSEYCWSYQGIKTGDDERFRRFFWEVTRSGSMWLFYQSTVKTTRFFGGLQYVIDWSEEGRNLARRQGISAWGKTGVMVSQMRHLPCSLYLMGVFDSNASALVPKNPAHLPAIWAFCSSPEFSKAVRRIDQKLNVTNATLVKVPFDLEYWTKVAQEQYPDGLPEPYSNDPTQWLFKGHPVDSTAPLQVAVARLLGYRWPEQEPDELDRFADGDGIVPLPALGGERSAADRLRELLAAAWGEAWSPAVEQRLLAEVGFANRTLEDWLRDGFFAQHVRLFHNRPFIWHIWDGRKDGFSVLVNYHKLDGPKLDRLIYTYLGNWIARQRADREAEVPGAEVRLAAALVLEEKLKRIREGEPPYDIYVRWKPLHAQPMGWEPDLNDGVRINIRPWIKPFAKPSESPLRAKVNVNWNTDRGKNPDGSKRRNDIHLSLAEKRAAREAVRAGAGG